MRYDTKPDQKNNTSNQYDNSEERAQIRQAIQDLNEGDEITVKYYPKSKTEVKTAHGTVVDTKFGTHLDFKSDRQTKDGFWRIRSDCDMKSYVGYGSYHPFLGWFRDIDY